MGSYQIIDHTADLAVEVSGENIEDLFRTAYQAWYDIVFCSQPLTSSRRKTVGLEALTLEELLVNFISELNYWLMVKKWLPTEIKKMEIFSEQERKKLWVLVKGQPLDPRDIQLEIKAVTFHQMEIKKKDGKLTTRLVFDI